MPMRPLFKSFGNRPAVIDETGTYSFAALLHLSKPLRKSLARHHVTAGDRVVVIQKNSLRSILTLLTVADIGAISVPLSTLTPASRICEIIVETNAALCICEEFVVEALKSAGANRCPLLSVNFDQNIAALKIYELTGRCTGINPKGSRPLNRHSKDNNIFTILYTSGTTGSPKGVLLSRSNIDFAVRIIDKALNISSDDVMYTPIEYNYAAGLLQLFAHLWRGATVCTGFDLLDSHQLLRALVEHSITTLACVPSTMHLLIRAYGDALFPFLTSLRKIEFSSSPLDSQIVNSLHAKLPKVTLFNTYGLTEALRVTYYRFPRHEISRIPIGHVNEDIQVSLNGNATEDFASGEMMISGPTIALGYLNSPEETKKLFTPFGYISGDSVKMIGGLLYLEGRNTEIINVGAHRVSLVEVENEITAVQGVHEVAIYVKEHQILDKILIANIVGEPQVSKRDIVQHLKNRLEPYKIPGQINFVDEIPKSQAGKIMRKVLQ